MAAPTYLTWDGGDGSLPRRPSADDLGGDEKLDNDEKPPDDGEHFTAGGWNQKVKQLKALARVASPAKIEVRFDGGGAPFVNGFTAAGTLITGATFAPTDNGNGDTTIAWPANTFPVADVPPNALTLYSAGTSPITGHVEVLTNGIRVRTFLWNGSAWVATNIAWSINLN